MSSKTKYDLTGQQFGRLSVLGLSENKNKNGRQLWTCQCECGNVVDVLSYRLRSGHVVSCGCKKAEGNKIENPVKKERLHAVWINMLQRCYNPNHNSSKYYSEKGITVCDEWKDSYKSFREWAMNNGYDPNAPKSKCTIDRIDNSKGYSPENCRWVDAKVQQNNRDYCKNERRR